MTLSLKDGNSINEISNILYEFLPGSGSSNWKNHVTFETIANRVGVGDLWQGGSKLPAITILLELTFEHRRHLFEPLILAIVREGIKYRKKKQNPITAQEIKTVNGLLLELKCKSADLWDPAFLRSLEQDGASRTAKIVDETIQSDIEMNKRSETVHRLEKLRQDFYLLSVQKDRQKAGLAFEKLLNELFELFQLAPRASFKIVGEQIDGSFELDNEIYLVEAKWEAGLLSEAPLLIFEGKIDGKSQFTRGLFISLNGFSAEALAAIVHGKQPNFFMLDGYDFMTVLEGNIRFDALLRAKLRVLAEEGDVFVSAKPHTRYQGRTLKDDSISFARFSDDFTMAYDLPLKIKSYFILIAQAKRVH